MNFVSWLLGLSIMVTILHESQKFHEATVCRQEAWRAGLVLRTRQLLPNAPEKDSLFNLPCQSLVVAKGASLSWGRNSLPKNVFALDLKGKL